MTHTLTRRPKKILIVEDEINEAMVLRKMLELWGYEVCEIAASGEDAIRKVEIEKPDLVLMDIYMHGISGIEAAGKIRSRNGMPIIFMTGYPDEQTRQKAYAVHPAGYFIKPLDYKKLKEALKSILYKNR
jgi:CheY-like chemotaxis protein